MNVRLPLATTDQVGLTRPEADPEIFRLVRDSLRNHTALANGVDKVAAAVLADLKASGIMMRRGRV